MYSYSVLLSCLCYLTILFSLLWALERAVPRGAEGEARLHHQEVALGPGPGPSRDQQQLQAAAGQPGLERPTVTGQSRSADLQQQAENSFQVIASR